MRLVCVEDTAASFSSLCQVHLNEVNLDIGLIQRYWAMKTEWNSTTQIGGSNVIQIQIIPATITGYCNRIFPCSNANFRTDRTKSDAVSRWCIRHQAHTWSRREHDSDYW